MNYLPTIWTVNVSACPASYAIATKHMVTIGNTKIAYYTMTDAAQTISTILSVRDHLA